MPRPPPGGTRGNSLSASLRNSANGWKARSPLFTLWRSTVARVPRYGRLYASETVRLATASSTANGGAFTRGQRPVPVSAPDKPRAPKSGRRLLRERRHARWVRLDRIGDPHSDTGTWPRLPQGDTSSGRGIPNTQAIVAALRIQRPPSPPAWTPEPPCRSRPFHGFRFWGNLLSLRQWRRAQARMLYSAPQVL